MFSGRGRLALLEPPQIDSASLKKADRKLVSTFKRKSRQNAPIVKTLARMRLHDTW